MTSNPTAPSTLLTPEAGDAADSPFAAFDRTPAFLASCQALQPQQQPNDRERMFAAFSATYAADPADPSMVDDLAKFCDGWQAAKNDDPPALQQPEATMPAAIPLAVPDRPGAPTVARMRAVFEKMVNDTPPVQQHTDLRAVERDGALSHHEDPRTDLLWLGFALGMRAAARLAAEEAKKPDSTLNVLPNCLHDHITNNQAACLEWNHSADAEAAMGRIQNGLAGPGYIPDEDEPYECEAHACVDATQANPLPRSSYGRGSNISSISRRFYDEAGCPRYGAKASSNGQP